MAGNGNEVITLYSIAFEFGMLKSNMYKIHYNGIADRG